MLDRGCLGKNNLQLTRIGALLILPLFKASTGETCC